MSSIEHNLPPHENAETHKRVMAALENASPEEHRFMLKAAGIMTKAGKLADHYRSRKTTTPRSSRRRRSASRRAYSRAKRG